MNQIDISYFKAVIDQLPRDVQQKALQWYETNDDSIKAELSPSLQNVAHPKGISRYRFLASDDEINQTIFDVAFKKIPNQMIPSEASCPCWKKVCWIDTPRQISLFFRNPYGKILISIVFIFCCCVTGYKAYQVTAGFIASSLPFVINHTPQQIFHIFNTAMKSLEWIFNHDLEILFCTWATQTIILRLPEIPFLTSVVRKMNLVSFAWRIFVSETETITKFFLYNSITGFFKIWQNCNDMSLYLRDFAERSEVEIRALSKPKAYQLWVQTLRNIHFERPEVQQALFQL